MHFIADGTHIYGKSAWFCPGLCYRMDNKTTKLAYMELAKLQRRAEFGGGDFRKPE